MVLIVLIVPKREYENIIIVKANDEMGELVKLAVTEYRSKNKAIKVKMVSEKYDFKSASHIKIGASVLLCAVEDKETIIKKVAINDIVMVNLLERL